MPNSAPILPTTLNITRNDNDTAEGTWMRPSYVYSNLTSSQVDCGDSFWSEGCTANYCSKQDEATETAGRVMSIPYTISAILSPMVGFVVDKIGGRAIIATLASVTLIAVHTALAVTSISPVLPLIGQGVAYSLYAAVIWPSVPLTVRPHVVGTAFGTIMAIQNMGLTVFPLIIAAIHDYTGSYLPSCEWFFVACATCGALAGLFLNIVDCCKSNGRLNRRKPKLTGDRDDVDTSVVGDEGAVLELDISSLVSHSTL
jgi:MFS family permease